MASLEGWNSTIELHPHEVREDYPTMLSFAATPPGTVAWKALNQAP